MKSDTNKLIRGLLLLLITLLTTSAHAGELETVLGHYRDWLGGDAFLKMSTIHESGSIELGGLSGTIDAWSDRHGNSAGRMELGPIQQTMIVTKDQGWMATLSGQQEKLPDATLRDGRRGTLLNFADILSGADGVKLSLAVNERYDDAEWRVLHVDFGDNDNYDIFLDPTTGARHGYRVRADKQTRFVRESDWRMVDGVRVAFVQETISATPAENVTLRFKQVQLNATPPATWLDPPVARTAVSLANNTRRTAWIPFEFFDGNRIFIPATVNGKSTQVLLDTGASTTVLDQAFADQAGIKAEGGFSAKGAGGSETAAIASGVKIQLGELTLDQLNVAVLPIGTMSASLGHALTVILGKEVLNETVVDIDFAQHRIAFERADGYQPPEGSTTLPLKSNSQGLRTVDIAIENGSPIAALFDLGNGGPLAIYQSYWKTQHLDQNRPISDVLGGGVGGKQVEQQITVRRVALGKINLSNVPATLFPEGNSAVDSDRVLANVGIPVWSRFRLITDYARDRLFLLPNADRLNAPFEKDRTGLGVSRDGSQITVEFVAKNSPASRQGWKVGDRITKVAGEALLGTERHDIKWKYGAPGSEVSVSGIGADAKPFQRRLMLADYF